MLTYADAFAGCSLDVHTGGKVLPLLKFKASNSTRHSGGKEKYRGAAQVVKIYFCCGKDLLLLTFKASNAAMDCA
jgi:hypothetical protein